MRAPAKVDWPRQTTGQFAIRPPGNTSLSAYSELSSNQLKLTAPESLHVRALISRFILDIGIFKR